MKKFFAILFVSFLLLSNVSFAYSASSLKSQINYLEREIKQDKREISSIKYSDRISEYDKKRKIRRLENSIYQNKRKLQRIKYEYKKAIS